MQIIITFMGFISSIINQYFPYIGMKYINIPAAKKRWKNSLEKRIIEGKTIKRKDDVDSILFFSTHKSGSSIAFKYLKKIANYNNIKTINYDAYVASVLPNKKKILTEETFLNRAFCNKSYFFGCFRSYRNISNISLYKVILLLRDPRDVMVSYYYSMKYSNKIHHQNGLTARRRLKHITIDQYVIEILPRFKKVFEEYVDNLLGKEYVTFTKFEDLLKDSPGWLKKVAAHSEMKLPNSLIEDIAENINTKPRKEKKRSHLRKSSPGEYNIKLNKETIEILNKELYDILVALNYPV